MKTTDVLTLWSLHKERGLEPSPVSFRIRSVTNDSIQKLQQEYNVDKSTIINDLLALGINELNNVEK